jgi:hypothetical protein
MPHSPKCLLATNVRSALECGGSTPLWNNLEGDGKEKTESSLTLHDEEGKGGVEPPHAL